MPRRAPKNPYAFTLPMDFSTEPDARDLRQGVAAAYLAFLDAMRSGQPREEINRCREHWVNLYSRAESLK
jgi:hypothetical protein